MLNPLEKKIIQYLVEHQSESEFISIVFNNERQDDIHMAVKSLERKGYVKSACTLNSVSAKLTPDGRYYFEQEKIESYGCYYDSIKLLEEKITEAHNLINSKNKSYIARFIYNTFMTYKDEFSSGARDGFVTMNPIINADDIESYNHDLIYLCELLNKELAEQKKFARESNMQKIEINNNPVFNNENTLSASISLSVTIENVQKCDSLSPDERAELNKLLIELDACKKKKDKNLWDNAKKAIKWILEKGIEVGIAALPFIAQIIQ